MNGNDDIRVIQGKFTGFIKKTRGILISIKNWAQLYFKVKHGI